MGGGLSSLPTVGGPSKMHSSDSTYREGATQLILTHRAPAGGTTNSQSSSGRQKEIIREADTETGRVGVEEEDAEAACAVWMKTLRYLG